MVGCKVATELILMASEYILCSFVAHKGWHLAQHVLEVVAGGSWVVEDVVGAIPDGT